MRMALLSKWWSPQFSGYGYSEAPKQKGKLCLLLIISLAYIYLGFDASAAARVFNKLMKRLGHDHFVVTGNDCGYLISKLISVIFPEK